ncbi:MAG: HAMP domain-containing histidine kinase [Planctomycetes bacterium]|nr:HAMP domain-containing histidine kinase [Planctomycetota bacterium]
MKQPSIRTSLGLWFLGSTTVLLAGFAVTAYWLLARNLNQSLDHRLRDRAEALSALCEWEPLEPHAVEFESDRALPFKTATGGFEIRVWPGGELVGRSGVDPFGADSSSPVVTNAPRWNFTTVDGRPAWRSCRLTTHAVGTPDDALGLERPRVTLRVFESREAVDEQLAALRWVFVLVGGLTILLGMGFALLVSRRVVRPLVELGHAAAHPGSGQRPPLPRRGNDDEIDQLAAILEGSFQTLEDALARQTRFTADAAHELRNPIAVIRSASEVAVRKERSPEDTRAFLEDITATADRMGAVVEALLLLARLDEGRLRAGFARVDLAALAREAAKTHDTAEASVTIEAGPRTEILGQGGLLRVLIDNLIGNAQRFGGKETIEVTIAEDGLGNLVFAVRDRGPGIPPEARQRVFERFHRAEEQPSGKDGAGLGLSLVAEIARLHRARPWIEDAGPGTRLLVAFPMA